MPYAVSGHDAPVRYGVTADGQWYAEWLVTQTDVALATTSEQEFTLGGVTLPPIWTVSSYQAQLVVAGAATSLTPEIGRTPGFVAESTDAVGVSAGSGTYVELYDDLRGSGPTAVCRTRPTGGAATTVRTRVVIRGGH